MKERKPKVLIVEDESRNITSLKALVAPMDVETHIVCNGDDALETAKIVSPDVILVDIMMPGLDGIEMHRRLREEPATRNIPVVHLTGGVGFITKPLQDIIVEANVRSALRIKQLSDEVEGLMRQRSSLTHMIIHDINNLLAVSLGYATMLLSNETLSPTVRKAVSAIERSSEEIQIITSSLLEVDKLEAGALPISLETVKVWELAEERVRLLGPQLTERGIHLVYEVRGPEKDFTVRADRGLLSRVLDNTMFNAAKFCPDQGSIELSLSKRDGMCAVAVTNDGPPIPPDYHERIFEKFAQVEARHGTGKKGVGLGLAFCKMALDAMHGTIAVESPLAGRKDGVRFVFCLPLAEGSTALP